GELLFAAADEHLHVLRLSWLDGFAERGIVRRHVATAEKWQPFLVNNLRVNVADNLPPVCIVRHEQIADRILASLREFETELRRFPGKEFVRDLHKDPGSVTHARIGADRAAMLEVAENAQPVFDDLVRLAALDVRDEADAAGILVERRIVETLRKRSAGISG